MGFSAKVLCDSLNPAVDTTLARLDASRLTTMEFTYPRCIHSELMTHRLFSRSSASSRAIPVKKMLDDIREDPFVPISWGKNQKGMQAGEELSPETVAECKQRWLFAMEDAVYHASQLEYAGLHKQIVNRIVEPWMWITVIVTGVDLAWENFFSLRCHKDAEPHMQEIAYMAREAYDGSNPDVLFLEDDHAPLTDIGDYAIDENGDPVRSIAGRMELRKISTGRCARVSYLTHDGRRDIAEDIALHDRLLKDRHFSPFEHVATATTTTQLGGNFGPRWIQYRKTFASECCEKAPREPRVK